MCVCVHTHIYIYIYREGERELKKKIVGSHNYGGWQAPNLQGGSGGWRPRGEPVLQFKSKGHLLAEFPLTWGKSVFCSIQDFD